MGLCKCPKRKVTNLFCFVHRVNVCDDCVLTDHSRCTVQSYLKWLEDSDYSAVCALCATSILQGPVVRLSCYDVFHRECLRRYIDSTQADNCPKCKELIIPPSHYRSPVVDQLRHILGTAVSQRTLDTSSQRTVGSNSQRTVAGSSQRTVASNSVRELEPKYDKTTVRRSTGRWLRDDRSIKVLDDGMYRILLAVGLVVIVGVLFILLLTSVGRDMAKHDTTLDWNYNPHIKTGN